MKITDVTDGNMFWGVTLEGGKHYAQTVQKSFHISMAALEPVPTGKKDGKHTSVMIHHDKAEFLLCTLTQGTLFQQRLDLNFTEGEEVRFFLNGPGIVHLTGYLTPDEPLDDEAEFSDDEADSSFVEEDESDEEDEDSQEEQDSDAEEDSDEEVPKLKPIKFNMDSSPDSSPEKVSSKRKKSQKNDSKKKKKQRIESSDEEESEGEEESEELEENVEDDEEEDSDWETEEDSYFIDDEAEEADSDEEEEEESEEDDHMVASSGSFLQPQKAKVKKEMEKLKKDKTTVKKEVESPKTNGEQLVQNGTPEEGKKKKKKKKKKNKEQDSDQKSPLPKKRTIKGGVSLEDVKDGHGPEAVQGKMVGVYYTGKLESGKVFDSCTSGKPFKFKLGKGEVIKGWDNGLIGLKVGGKRKLVIPPSQGYGNQKTGPIPRNSTLHFEIELRAVS